MHIKSFYLLQRTILKVLNGRSIEEKDLPDSHLVLNVLREILAKKLKNINLKKAKESFVDLEFRKNMVDKINLNLKRHSSKKRVEENNKFIFKMIIKTLKKQYYEEQQLNSTITSEEKFYNHFFKETADELSTPLSDFYDPLYRMQLKNSKFKSINNKYLSLIFGSVLFKEKFTKVLDECFVEDYKGVSETKVFGVLRPLLEGIKEEIGDGGVTKVYEDFTVKLRRSKKCKLPWTSKEVNIAILQFKSFLN